MRAWTVFFCLAGTWNCTTRVSGGRPGLIGTGIESEAEAEAESESESESESEVAAGAADSGARQLRPDATGEPEPAPESKPEPATAFEPAPDAADPDDPNDPDVAPTRFDLGEPDAGTDAARTDAGADAAVLSPDALHQPCSESLHLVGGSLCFEPASDVSAVAWIDADAACRSRELRLCTREERRLACAELGADVICAGLLPETGSWEWSSDECGEGAGCDVDGACRPRAPCCNENPGFEACQPGDLYAGGYHCCADAD